ncbi:unnamed protein product [Pocillopora meandrina]|uniref:Sulfotransferase domain-containing protein n=1 Tax=Pocillopora meandrina TaxID=46732 RepID=A0AAU9VLA7_9CNID|nr:unnamed protein product [Pocillopora meandrina]
MESLPVFQVKVNEWTSEKYFDVLGMKIPVFVAPNPKLLSDVISNFQTRAEDVFVVTYPKSGTIWMQETIWQIYNNGENTSKNIFERVPFLEFSTSPILGEFADIAKVPSPRLMKSHLSYSIIPKGSSDGAKCKYIYIARNPKDVAVSYFHFTVSLASFGNGYNGPWEIFPMLYCISLTVGWNKWNDHVLGWWKHKDDPNVLFLKYEDLKKDLPSQVRLTANFLNKPLSEDIINRITEQCSFNGMTKDLSRYMVHVNESQTSILRKGVVGDWKNSFTPELNERFEKEVLSKIEGTRLEFDFEL